MYVKHIHFRNHLFLLETQSDNHLLYLERDGCIGLTVSFNMGVFRDVAHINMITNPLLTQGYDQRNLESGKAESFFPWLDKRPMMVRKADLLDRAVEDMMGIS